MPMLKMERLIKIQQRRIFKFRKMIEDIFYLRTKDILFWKQWILPMGCLD